MQVWMILLCCFFFSTFTDFEFTCLWLRLLYTLHICCVLFFYLNNIKKKKKKFDHVFFLSTIIAKKDQIIVLLFQLQIQSLFIHYHTNVCVFFHLWYLKLSLCIWDWNLTKGHSVNFMISLNNSMTKVAI